MPTSPDTFSQTPEALIVGLAKTGDSDAFAELINRRQAWVRNLLRRYCGDPTLADDLAQQTFLQAWRDIKKIRDAHKFGGWLRKVAVNTWHQHLRKNDSLKNAQELGEEEAGQASTTGIGMDLDHALSLLNPDVRQCIILSYHEGMSHSEITALTGIPSGTVKSHIRRGTEKLKATLAAYTNTDSESSP